MADEGKDLNVFRTVGIDGWILPITSASVNGFDFPLPVDPYLRELQINPQFQYTYIPQADFQAFSEAAQSTFKDIIQFHTWSANNTALYLNQRCSTVPNKNFDFEVTITDSNGVTDTLRAKQDVLFVDGKVFGREDTCYLSVFGNIGDSV